MSKKRNLASLSILVIGLSFLLIKTTSHRPVIVTNHTIKAAIIPHHLVAAEFMADLGLRLAKQNPSQITIIGPNHDEVGKQHFITDTVFFSDNNPLVQFAPDLVAKDHACFAPRGVLQPYLPQTKFLCVLISSRSTPEEIASLAKTLSGVVVASVDFSHYQTLQKASENDQFTQKNLESFNSSSLVDRGNSFLDSPKTIATLFKYLSLNSINKFELINHSNSAQILNVPFLSSTTSYFEYIYY